METRIQKTTVTFKKPVFLSGIADELPAGRYDIETEEELIEGASYLAYRRISTVLYRQGRGKVQAFRIDPDELAAALK